MEFQNCNYSYVQIQMYTYVYEIIEYIIYYPYALGSKYPFVHINTLMTFRYKIHEKQCVEQANRYINLYEHTNSVRQIGIIFIIHIILISYLKSLLYKKNLNQF